MTKDELIAYLKEGKFDLGELIAALLEYIDDNEVNGCGQKNLFGIKRIVILVNGQIDFAMHGKGYCSLTKVKNSTCIKNR